MKTKIFMASVIATMLFSCTTEQLDTKEVSNQKENLEIESGSTARLVGLAAPSRISANFPGKFRVTIDQVGNRRVEWFVDGVLVRTQLTAGNIADFSLIPNDYGMAVGSTHTVAVRQKGTTERLRASFVVGSNDPFFP